jgi:hypothetical protein
VFFCLEVANCSVELGYEDEFCFEMEFGEGTVIV